MLLEFWDRIAYMAELLAACILFMMPLRRGKRFVGRMSGMIVLLLALSWGLNALIEVQHGGVIYFIYWAVYIVICIIFTWFCLECSLMVSVYYTVCACAVQHIAHDGYLIIEIMTGKGIWFSFPVYTLIYLLAYFFMAKKMTEQENYVVSKKVLFPIVTILLIVWILSILDDTGMVGFDAEPGYRVMYRMLDALCCFYVLWGQVEQKERMSLQRELDGIGFAWRKQKEQYEMTRETIDNINRKCHDLKHQIRALRKMENNQEKEEYLKEVENDIMVYDTALCTGNSGLDVVLMEKGLFCKNHGIQLSYMLDGSRLEFMKLEDIYAIFGNALDNAVHAVMKLEEPEKKVISLKMITQNKLLVIQILNYYHGEIHFEEGLPLTTKANRQNHGFGMKSIRHTTEKYNGTITVQVQNDIFKLQILIPVPENDTNHKMVQQSKKN